MKYFYVYILFSLKDKKLYIGFTSYLEKRLQQHQDGLVTSTKTRLPIKLVYFEGHTLKADALRREAYFKTTSGKRTIQIILKDVLKELGYKS